HGRIALAAGHCRDAIDVDDAHTAVVGHQAGIRPLPCSVGEHLDALPHGAREEPAVAAWIKTDDGALARALLPTMSRPAVDAVDIARGYGAVEVCDCPRRLWRFDSHRFICPVHAGIGGT